MLAAIPEEAVLSKFPKQKLTRIIGEPEYTQLQTLRAEVYANASAVRTTLGFGVHGHLGAVMPDATYFQKTGAHFVLGTDPGNYDQLIPNNATAAALNHCEAQFNARKQHMRCVLW